MNDIYSGNCGAGPGADEGEFLKLQKETGDTLDVASKFPELSS